MYLSSKILRLERRVVQRAIRHLVRPWLTMPQIENDLRALGVRTGGILLVHSSLSALGYVVDGAPAVLEALIKAIGPGGTLVLPTHSWRIMEAGRRDFDVRTSSSCVGAIPETFRRMPGVVRSLHPTHSVAAMGPLAGWLIADHEYSQTPCGEGTPYARVLDHNGQILLLGVGLTANTAFHAIEALVQVPYLMNTFADRFTVTDALGVRRTIGVPRHRSGIARRFQAMERLLLDRQVAHGGLVGKAPSLLIDGTSFRDEMVKALANEPGLFLADQVESPTTRFTAFKKLFL
ncbi:aminoglycoside 3-N-acetyltransferase [Singulisphaera sp. GP187]|uniref:AAC(3) family N-acetyltransferase n=1 Tax=Singulisphaera sp. GP187 TaxID=1882752 RepID=UPI00092B9E8C|nr:AAC(3) family N-acetyltransferase [Singulisphaera sp. GP187]SIO09853.1 aminoglycoside 3-N-acetyltransferase [Singulisphaera sp. GP187]